MTLMTLGTERLDLLPVVAGHARQIFVSLQDERIYEYIPDIRPESVNALEERFQFLAGAKSRDGTEIWANWIGFLRETDEAVGWFQATVHADHTADMAYVLFPQYWRLGYAREACREMVRHLLVDLKCTRIQALIDTENARSIRLVELLGFTRADVIRNAAVLHGRDSHEYRYVIDRSSQ